MPSTNKVFVMGNLTRDPELRTLPSGNSVCEFGLAVSDQYTNKRTGQREEQVHFIDCVAWSKNAEMIHQHFSKGRPIFIEGRLRYEQWDDRETGNKRSKLKVVVGEWRFVDSSNNSSRRSDPSETADGPHVPLDGDEIPF